MEHPSKRRRVERRRVTRPEKDNTIRARRQRIQNWGNDARSGDHVDSQHTHPTNGEAASPILGSIRQETEAPNEPLDLSESSTPKLELRQLVPTPAGYQPNSIVQPVQTGAANVIGRAETAAQPVQNPVATVINVAVSDGKGVVSHVVEPVVSQVAAIPGYGALSVSTPSVPTNLPGVVVPLPAVAAAEARNQALASQVALARELAASAASHIPISIQVPGASSQHVLSSPSTPLPSTPHATSASTSYFSSSTVSPSESPRPNTSSAPAVSSANRNAPTSRNSTMTGKSPVSVLAPICPLTNCPATSSSSGKSSMTSSINAAYLASQASVSSLEALTASLTGSQASNALVAATQSRLSPSASATSGLSTFMTMTSASTQLSSQSSFASSAASSSGVGAGVGGAGNTAAAPSATSSSGSGSGAGTGIPPTPVLVGGIVGGVAGLVMVLLVGLFLLRWRKGKLGQRKEISLPTNPRTLGPGGVEKSGTMTERSSTAPIAAAGFFGRLRPSSSQTAGTTDTAPSERGFQKISGRKLTSVLTSGGDGYGDSPAGPTAPPARGIAPGQGPFAGLAPALRPSPPHSLSGSSFYRDSQGFYGGLVPDRSSDPTGQATSPPSSSPSSPTPLALGFHPPQGGASPSRRAEIANMRPGPARTPTIHQPGVAPMRTPSRTHGPPPRPVRATPPPVVENTRPTLGRSLTSQDGSRSSRFQESTTPP